MKSQNARLLSHFKQGRKISSLSAYPLLGIASLHRRLTDLRRDGKRIDSKWENIQNPYGERQRVKVYWMPR